MADIKEEQSALFGTIYKIATDLVHAGHVSEWDFKSYVLVTMFYRYISENLATYINAGERAAGMWILTTRRWQTRMRKAREMG